MTSEELETILKVGHESNGVEFKGPGKRTDKDFMARVVRAAIGMSNRRDGGVVIIGVEDQSINPIGLNDEEFATWQKYDDISDSINSYASPSIQIELSKINFKDKNIIVLHISEFSSIPTLCKKDFRKNDPKQTGCTSNSIQPKDNVILRSGACYVRSLHKPETSEIPTEQEMRELLNLATEKCVQRFVQTARNAGMFPIWPEQPTSASDEELFEKQIDGFCMSSENESEILRKIKSRGYWKVVLRPTTFQKDLIKSRADLFPIVRERSVKFRGWDFPHISNDKNPIIGEDWAGQEYGKIGLIESWRIYQSGLFIDYFSIDSEWMEENHLIPANRILQPGSSIYYQSTIYVFMEIFEFASRLSRSPAGTDFMRVNIELHGLSERRLVETDIRFLLPNRYISNQPDWTFNQTYSFIDLTTQSRDFAAHAARELFVIFGYDVSIESLKRIQDLLVRR